VIDPSWRIEDVDPDETSANGPQPALVNLHFLRSALQRRWRVWFSLGCAGFLMGLALTVLMPPASKGTVTLLLAHDPATDPATAMATDVSLLQTRDLGALVVNKLHLPVAPDVFQNTVTAVPVTSNVLVLTVAAPDDRNAIVYASVLANQYLGFRAKQIESQSNALVDGYRSRVAALQKQVGLLSKQYDALSSSGASSQSEASIVLTQRSTIQGQITTLQQSMQDAALLSDSIVKASHVVDTPAAMHKSAKKRLVLNTVSGAIGGTAIGVGLVLFMALTSDKLRRREEVAMALGAPVRLSVGRLPRRAWPGILQRGPTPTRDLQILVHGLDTAISPRKGHPPRLAIASIDNIEATQLVTAAFAADLLVRGVRVFAVDLSEAGKLESALGKAIEQGRRDGDESVTPVVFRPEGVPSLSRGPVGATAGTSDLPKTDPRRPAWDAARVILTLAEVDPAVGVDHVKSWADQVVLVVTAGRSNAERLRTTAELLRAAGLKLSFVIMVGADRIDESLGLPDTPDEDWQGSRRTSS
jgi:hypothetical protein